MKMATLQNSLLAYLLIIKSEKLSGHCDLGISPDEAVTGEVNLTFKFSFGLKHRNIVLASHALADPPVHCTLTYLHSVFSIRS